MKTQIALLSFALVALLACSEDAPDSPPCKYEVQEHQTPALSTYAHQLNVPFDQETLIRFMNVEPTQSECFARQYAPIRIYRVPFMVQNDYTSFLRPAPTAALTTWRKFEASFGFNLKGLTTFRYYPGAQEKITEAFILLRDDASAWHMWHEFSHFIIGTERAKSHDHSLHIAEKDQLEKLKSELLESTNDGDTFSEKLQKYFNDNHEYLQKRFVDEIIIEASLIYITSQNPLLVKQEEIHHAQSLIQSFSLEMSIHIFITRDLITNLKNNFNLLPEQITLLKLYEDRLDVQSQGVSATVSEAVGIARQFRF